MVCIRILLLPIRKKVRSFTESPAEFREIAENAVKVAGLGIGIGSAIGITAFLLISLLCFAAFGAIAVFISVIQALSCF